MLDDGSQAREIGSGRRLIDALLQDGMDIQAAFWLEMPNGKRRLYIATPEVIKSGPRSVLNTVAIELGKMNGQSAIELYDINIVSPQNPEILHLLGHVPVGGTIIDTRLSNMLVDDVLISDLFLYIVKTDINDQVTDESIK